MGQLDTLPRELVYLILEHCDFDGCKNLRETCKYLSDLANTRVFQSYCIAFFQSHLERFVGLSSKPEIARCIKRLVFVGDVIPQMDWYVCGGYHESSATKWYLGIGHRQHQQRRIAECY